MFTHLNVRSYYSFLCGASSPEGLCQAARQQGHKQLALTDVNGMHGALAFCAAAERESIRPILGTTLQRSLGKCFDTSAALVLARDNEGFAECCRLVSQRQLNPEFELVKALARTSAHVAIVASELVLAQEIKAVGARQDVFVELSDTTVGGDRAALSVCAAQVARAGFPSVASNRVCFAQAEDHAAHQVVNAMRVHATLASLSEKEYAGADAFLKNELSMRARFRQLPEVLARTEALANQLRGLPARGQFQFPVYPCPTGETEFSYLADLCWEGLEKRYRPKQHEVLSRLTYELSIIEQKGFSGYFLAVWDIVMEAQRRGIPTVGRGSAANSLVAHCLGITAVDPLKNGLFFERFLNLERADPPDIDLDFPWDQRDEMLKYAYQRFGQERVAMIGTFVRMHARSAVREVAKAFGINEDAISEFCKRLPMFGRVEDVSVAQAQVPECRDLPIHDEPWKSVLALAAQLEGVPRHMSVHPGGICLAPGPVENVMPTQMAAKGVVVTQYDMYAVEDSGFVKIDLLGQRGLAVIRDTSKAAGVHIAALDPYTDEGTKRLLREGETLGCFYVESPAMRLLLRKLKCDEFGLLTAASSVIRPGVSNSGMMRMFIERHLGIQPAQYAHPCLIPLLQDTHGVMVYQEDVIKVVHELSGMSWGEADKLRRCMSKKRHWAPMETYRERFFKGVLERGLTQAEAEEIWRQIEAFGGYAFCKAHSASYAVLSFQSAYLKTHYPAEFLAAVLSNQGGFYQPSVYFEEARRMGVQLLPPHINISTWRYIGHENSIRMGFLAIRGLDGGHMDALVQERDARGPFKDLSDLIRRACLTGREMMALIAAGACDEFAPNRVQLGWELRKLQTLGSKHQGNKDESYLQLDFAKPQVAVPPLTYADTESVERHYMGMSPKAHPLESWREQWQERERQEAWIRAREMPEHIGKLVRLCGWVVVWRRTRVHATGEWMKFMTLEDETATFEVVVFPKVYQRVGHCLAGRGPYWVEGVVDNDRGGMTLVLKNIEKLRINTTARDSFPSRVR